MGTEGPVTVMRFVHVDSYDRIVSDEEEYKGKYDFLVGGMSLVMS